MHLGQVEDVARELLTSVATEVASTGQTPSVRRNRDVWTRALKRAFILRADALSKAGGEWAGLYPCASGAPELCEPYRGDKEWVVDVCWLVFDPPSSPGVVDSRLVAIPLALESEMGEDRDEDDIDFLKLVSIRAGVRVMVQRERARDGVQKRVEHYQKVIDAFHGSERGDRYLFAIYVEADKAFVFVPYEVPGEGRAEPMP